MEIYERILRELKNFPEIPRLILLHSMLIGLRISEVCTLKGDAYSWQGRDAWIQVYQMKMRTYKRVPIPDVLYKIMKRYLENIILEVRIMFSKQTGRGISVWFV